MSAIDANQRRASSGAIADVAIHHPADRSRQKTQRKHRESIDQGRERVARRKEQLRRDRCQIAVEGKVVPLDDIADDARRDDLARLRARIRRAGPRRGSGRAWLLELHVPPGAEVSPARVGRAPSGVQGIVAITPAM
jgi:hypothetical protein